MPNWCYNRITIEHENEKELEKLSQLIEEWTSKNYMENGFGLDWLGNIVGNSGVGTIDENKETDLSCRGRLYENSVEGNQLLIGTETAWGPMLQMWVKVLEKYLPDAKLLFTAEEPNMGITITNDPDLAGKYILDVYDIEDIEQDWEISKESLIVELQGLLKTEESDFDKLQELLSDSEYDDKLSIYEWEFCDVSECE